MKYRISKKMLFGCTFILLSLAGIVAVSIIGLRLLPNAIGYSIPQHKNEKAVISEVTETKDSKECAFGSVSEIDVQGPFTIKSEDNSIYVLHDSKYLYRVSAHLSEFPEKDVKTISDGIHAENYSELCEIISYLES